MHGTSQMYYALSFLDCEEVLPINTAQQVGNMHSNCTPGIWWWPLCEFDHLGARHGRIDRRYSCTSLTIGADIS